MSDVEELNLSEQVRLWEDRAAELEASGKELGAEVCRDFAAHIRTTIDDAEAYDAWRKQVDQWVADGGPISGRALPRAPNVNGALARRLIDAHTARAKGS